MSSKKDIKASSAAAPPSSSKDPKGLSPAAGKTPTPSDRAIFRAKIIHTTPKYESKLRPKSARHKYELHILSHNNRTVGEALVNKDISRRTIERAIRAGAITLT